MGELADAFANETERLAKLARYIGNTLERTVELEFITGFPDYMSVELKKLQDIHSMAMRDVNMSGQNH